MALNVSRDTIKRKCRIAGSDFDDEIDETIDEQLPVIEYAIVPVHVADSELESTLNLGAAEIIAGEFLAQLCREPGATERLEFGDFAIGPRTASDPADPFGLKRQGWERLSPFLKPNIANQLSTKTSIVASESKLRAAECDSC
ncbi:MAG: hypothetical protein KIT74_02660 [Fimbriimonadales bacterium]|nr:hypothetical protein [Fimbriimonadales bacterium]